MTVMDVTKLFNLLVCRYGLSHTERVSHVQSLVAKQVQRNININKRIIKFVVVVVVVVVVVLCSF